MMVAILVCAIPSKVAWSAEDATCLSATGEAAIAPCRRELLRDPGNVEIRFALSDAFMGLRRYADAVAVLQEGLENFPGDDEIKKKLILAESYLDEQQYIEKQQKRAAEASRSKKQDTQIRLSIIRCEKLKGDAAMAACNEGLAVNPDHPGLLTGRGNVWMEMDRFGNAIRDYEAALAADPKNREATKSLRLAQTKRDVKVAQCLQAEGPDGLKACDAALMKGASDEFAVRKRQAGLLQASGREKEAIEAYRVAARLNPSDDQVKQSLAALSPRSDKPTARPAPEPSPIVSQATGTSAVQPRRPPVKKSSTRPVAPASPPIKAAATVSRPPVLPPPANVFEPPEVKKPVQEAAQQPKPLKLAASQQRQYSNAPEVPGITH
jgi:tetratricopeptide (TPR) repeat protein